MAITKMQKIAILAHTFYHLKVIDFLQKAGVVEIRELSRLTREKVRKIEGMEDKDLEEMARQLKESIVFLGSFLDKKKGFIEGLIGEKRPVKEGEAAGLLEKFDYYGIVRQCQNISSKLSNLKISKEKLISDRKNLSFFSDLNIKLCDSCGTLLTEMAVGSFSLRNYNEFSAALKFLTPFTEIRVVKRESSKIYLLLVYLKEQKKLILDTLHKYSFNKFTFHAVPRKPADEIKALEEEIGKIEKEEESLTAEAKDLARDIPSLQIIYDLLKQRIDQLWITQKFGRTEASLVIEGWIEAKEYESLKKSLEKEIPEAEIIKIEPVKGEVPPVAISNPKPLKPFEFITQLYGLPNYNEIDPTSALAAFFILFFAICLTDAGYGIILAFLSWLALKKLDLGEGGKKFFRLLFLGGIVTFFVGAITGGWFGVGPDKLPATFGLLKAILIKIKLFDPMKDILGMLIFSLALGVIHVIFGILISCYEKIRAGDIVSAIFDDLAWVYFILSLIFWGTTKALSSISQFSGTASYLSLSGAILIVLAQGRSEKNILMKFLVGLYKLYNITSYFGNVLSYSRLLALALTSTGIAMAINTICGIVTGIPYVGYLVVVIVWLLGHTFNLVLSILSAFIHSMRLQYVEFYLQFFKGGGRAFKPFRVETEYIKLT